MSEARPSVPGVFHPWRHLRGLAHVEVFFLTLSGRRRAATNGVDVIVMHPRLNQAQRRCALAHELAHIELGHTDGASPVEERAAAVLAARRLIRADALADAMLWSQHPHDVADALWVDVETLTTRLEHLHPAERHYLTQRLAAREDTA